MSAPNDDDDVLASFIAAEHSRPEDTDGQDEMRARLATSLGIPLSAPAPTEDLARRTLSAASRLKALVILAVGFGAGFTTHALLPSRSSSLPVPVVVAAQPSVPASVAPVGASASAEPPSLDPSSLPRVDVAASSSSPAPAKSAHAPGSVADVEAERLQLETARAAMRRGDAAGALRLLQDHKSRFPRGQLREERDGMTVSVLGMLGRTAEAEKAAARFASDYPMSLQGAAMPHPDAGR